MSSEPKPAEQPIQSEFLDPIDTSSAEWRLFDQAREFPRFRSDPNRDKKLFIAFSDGETLTATKQSQNRFVLHVIGQPEIRGRWMKFCALVLKEDDRRISEQLKQERAAKRAANRATAENAEMDSGGLANDSKLRSDARILKTELAKTLKSKPAALILQQFGWLLGKTKCGVTLKNGRRYIFGTYEQLSRQYFDGCYSPSTIRDAVRLLEKRQLVDSKQPDGWKSRRKYYTLTEAGWKALRLDAGASNTQKLCDGETTGPNAQKLCVPKAQNLCAAKEQNLVVPNAQKLCVPLKSESSSDSSSGSSSTAHDHGHEVHASDGGAGAERQELTPQQCDLLNQIEELTRSENRVAKFRRIWVLKIQDHPNQVFQAIGETRMMVREGRIRKTIGGTLLWNYNFFLKAAGNRREKK